MSETESLKRTNEEPTEETTAECSRAPEPKIMKLETEEPEPNLKNGTNECETSTETVSPETEANSSSISIKFQDNIVAELYKSRFIKFLRTFSEFRIEEETDLTLSIYRDKDDLLSPKKHKKRSKVKKELFVVDATPSEAGHPNDLRYTPKFTINTDKTEEEATQASRSGCFNCGDFHALKDCPHPKDHARINEARQKFKSQGKQPSRYHLEVDQKYSHFQPGKISSCLRKALGLGKNEAPHFIYTMRQLGYPPGWLEEAKIVHSNLDLFDIDGNHVKGGSKAPKQGLDEEKIVEYPGFNVPFPKGVKDDHRSFRVPPYSDDFNKKAMIDFYDKQFTREQDNLEACDMDLDPDCSNVEMKRDSPTLIDLEQQKRQLLDELKVDSKDSESDSDKGLSSAVKTSCFGTPILKSSSPYATLPNPDNFSKDVSPVINFENLPNSTGKYEQLNNVLQKVRTTLKKNICNT